MARVGTVSLVGDSLHRGSVILARIGTVSLVGDSLYRGESCDQDWDNFTGGNSLHRGSVM